MLWIVWILFLGPEGPPDNIRDDTSIQQQLSYHWAKPICGQRRGVITYYEVYFGEVDGNKTSKTTTDVEITFFDLPHFTYYEFEIRAYTLAPGPNSTAIISCTAESGK